MAGSSAKIISSSEKSWRQPYQRVKHRRRHSGVRVWQRRGIMARNGIEAGDHGGAIVA